MNPAYSTRIEFNPANVVEALGNTLLGIRALSPDRTAGVLFVIQWPNKEHQGPVLLLNKRSSLVRQPGDLCCPGGRVHARLDKILGRLLRLPVSPLVRSRGWRKLGQEGAHRNRLLSIFWACCLRESWEEMGLRPWKVEFLGVLPLDQLKLFKREILPMVGWTSTQRRFRPNWEVELILPISFDSLLDSGNYGTYIFLEDEEGFQPWGGGARSFPCFIHKGNGKQEILWGATYRIVVSFLKLLYHFEPPPMQDRPVIRGSLSQSYLTGKSRNDSSC